MAGLLEKLGLIKSAPLETSYDYIIVGAGSAGCILANRLSANPKVSVLLLEAGKEDSSWLLKMPFASMVIAYQERFSWMHRTKPSPHINNRRIDWPRGKVLGGSSSTNGMIYIRGQAQDYDHWAALGNQGWSWQEVLPYFKKLEDHCMGESETRGVGGEIHIQQTEQDELGDRYIKACIEAGVSQTSDFNTGDQEGVGYFHVNVKKGVRQSTSQMFLKPVRSRPNLTVVTSAMVEKVVFDNKTASAVQFKCKKAQHTIDAQKEVILSAGAINTPQLLQLSGVGPKALLEKHGIKIVKELLGVGQNLQDHLGVMVARQIEPPITLAAQMKPHRLIYNFYRYLRFGQGTMNMTAAYVGVFFKSREGLEYPDMQLHFSPVSGYRKDGGESVMDKLTGATSVVTPTRPESRGWVRIKSNDPNQHPEIEANYLSTEKDQQDMLEAIRMQRKFFEGQAIKEISGIEIRPGEELQSDEELMAYIKETCVTNYHPVGTCKMGRDDMAVVDEHLRVHGLNNIRVVDASIMPNIISGNTNAASMMIGEKGAELVLVKQE